MNRAYKTLTDDEFNVLNKVLDRTKMDCWCWLKQDCHGADYIYDMEERKRMCLKTGVGLIADGLDCQENLDNCYLNNAEKIVLRSLFEKLKIKLSPDIVWGV